MPNYAAIKMPTLLIAGREDKSVPIKRCETIYKRTGVEKMMEVLDGMGHWMCVEDLDVC